MSANPATSPDARHGQQFSVVDLGPTEQLARYFFSVPALGGRDIPGKIFLKGLLCLTGAEISCNRFMPGVGMPFSHTHRENEEIYLFLDGNGEFQVDGECFPITAGSVVRVAPAGVRAYRNTGDTPMHFIVIQVRHDSLQQGTVEDGCALPGRPQWPRQPG